MYVFDATPLIYLAKANRLASLADLAPTCTVPESVYEEVVTVGMEQGHADARRIERAVENGIVDVVAVAETKTFTRLRRNQNLSRADAAVLAHAETHDATAVMDETYGRAVADAEDIPTRGTAYLVLRLLEDDVLSADEARKTIDEMMAAGWYCAPDLYTTIRRKIDAVS